MNKFKGWLTGLGGIALIFSISVLGMLVVMLFINGAVWVGRVAYPVTVFLSQIALAFLVLVFLPLSFIRKTYDFSATGILIVSYVLGLSIWVVALLETYRLWGVWGVAIGLIFMGVGVVPMAVVALIFHGAWSACGQLLLAIAIMWAVRMFSYYVAGKEARKQEREFVKRTY